MFRFEFPTMKSFMMLGVAVLMTGITARAEGVQIILEQMRCFHLTDGEPGSEDEVYFTVAGLHLDQTGNQTQISYPKVGSATDDHWDMQPGQTVTNARIYQGYLGRGEHTFVTVLMRESDGGLWSAITNAIGAFFSNLSVLQSGFSWGSLTPLVPMAQAFTNSLSADNDQTLGALAILLDNINGSLQVQMQDALPTISSTIALGGNRFQTVATGGGASYLITYRVELYQGDRIDNVRSGLCLDVPFGSHDSGVQVQQYPCNTGANQKWIYIPDNFNATPSYFTIVNDESGKCLDVRDASTVTGGIIQQFSCHGGTNQRWHFKPAIAGQGTGQIQNDGSRMCLDVPNASFSITGIQQYTCSVPMGKNQAWVW